MRSFAEIPLLSVVVACFNDETVLPITHQRLLNVLGNNARFTLEIIYIDDGSADRTYDVIAGYAQADNRIEAIQFARNFGQQAAISAGLRYAHGDAVAIMDSDLQDPPEVILQMLDKWFAGYDVVYGVRQKRKETLFKRLGYDFFYRVMDKLADIPIPRDSGDFSVMDRSIVDAINALPERTRFVRGLRAWCGSSQYAFAYERQSRVAGESYYHFHKVLKLALDGFFNFSVRPLTFITLTGILTSLLSFLAMIFFFIARVFNFRLFGHAASELPGFTVIILSILFLSGVQLLALGILGEYLGRVYEEIKNRPVFLTRRHQASIYAAGTDVVQAPQSTAQREKAKS